MRPTILMNNRSATAGAETTMAQSAAIPTDIAALSLNSLRVELHRRQLCTTGLLEQLRLRLARQPKRPLSVPISFPEISTLSTTSRSRPPVRGVLRHRSVWITGDHSMHAFWQAGQCGKANLSRSAPSYNRVRDDTLKGRAMRQLIVLEGGGDVCQRANVEHLQLTLVEAFYAAFVEHRLHIVVQRDIVDATSAWRIFCRRCPRFPWMFVVYSRYRTTGWYPRSGLKYGVDWVLYPAKTRKHTHSPYCVVLKFGQSRESRIEKNWTGLQNRLRLVKNVAKTLIITQVFVDRAVDFTASVKQAFTAVKINELTIDRWIP